MKKLACVALATLVITMSLPLSAGAAAGSNGSGGALAEDLVILDASDIQVLESGAKLVTGSGFTYVHLPALSKAVLRFELEKAGEYCIDIKYRVDKSRTNEVVRRLEINGGLPFEEAEKVTFSKVYMDETEPLLDIFGNQIRPSQVESDSWRRTILTDYFGYKPAFVFNFKAGENTLALSGGEGDLSVIEIRLISASRLNRSYDELAGFYTDAGYTEYKGKPIRIEGESAVYKSDPTLYAAADYGSVTTSPYRDGFITLNKVSLQKPRQFLVWEFETPESGLYQISIKFRQNIPGVAATCMLLVDDELLCRELTEVEFPYSEDWENKVIGNGSPYSVYLKAGKHTIKMVCTAGYMGQIVKEAAGCLEEANAIYRQIIKITGTSPDVNRDYKLEKLIKPSIEQMRLAADRLKKIYEQLRNSSGGAGSNAAVIQTLYTQLNRLNSEPDRIARELNYLKSNIGAFGQWVNSASEQPLEIDYITLAAPGTETPVEHADFWQKLLHSVKNFVRSFTIDYARVGMLDSKNGSGLRVWVGTSRDQAQIMRNMINRTFTPRLGIGVTLELVNPATVLPATLTGNGPDIIATISSTDVINYASRKALYDLTSFPDYMEVSSRFYPQVLVPLKLNGKIFGLPESMNSLLLYYRTDILNELGINPPDTWENLIAVLKVLSRNNMGVALPVSSAIGTGGGLPVFYSLVYQNGGKIYSDDNRRLLLGDELSTAAFIKWTNFFVNYGMPLSYDLANRFRTGEIPIAISDYNFNNIMYISAPEIRGLWNFSLLPGVRKPDGSIDHTSVISCTACSIMSNPSNPDAAWEFLKWWTDEETQIEYNREWQSVAGAAAMQYSANLNAFLSLPWTNTQLETIEKHLESLRAVPEVIGGYATSRYLDFAFRKVTIEGKDAHEMLSDYVERANKELERKQKEFGLEVDGK